MKQIRGKNIDFKGSYNSLLDMIRFYARGLGRIQLITVVGMVQKWTNCVEPNHTCAN